MVRVPWNISKSAHKKLLGLGWLGSGGLGSLGVYINCYIGRKLLDICMALTKIKIAIEYCTRCKERWFEMAMRLCNYCKEESRSKEELLEDSWGKEWKRGGRKL